MGSNAAICESVCVCVWGGGYRLTCVSPRTPGLCVLARGSKPKQRGTRMRPANNASEGWQGQETSMWFNTIARTVWVGANTNTSVHMRDAHTHTHAHIRTHTHAEHTRATIPRSIKMVVSTRYVRSVPRLQILCLLPPARVRSRGTCCVVRHQAAGTAPPSLDRTAWRCACEFVYNSFVKFDAVCMAWHAIQKTTHVLPRDAVGCKARASYSPRRAKPTE